MDRSLRCDVAGLAIEGGYWLDAPCYERATHRYKPVNDPDAPWGYRCAEHAKFSVLAPEMAVEEIGGQS